MGVTPGRLNRVSGHKSGFGFGGGIDNIFLVTWNTTKGCETHMFWVIGLREGTPGYSSSKTEGWDIHNDRKYTLRLLAKDTCNIFGGLSQC